LTKVRVWHRSCYIVRQEGLNMTKIEELAKYLEVEADDLTEDYEDTFRDGKGEYLVLTDEEADEKAKEYILDSVWAFNANFLAAHCLEGIGLEVIEAIQANERCESNNKALLALIEDVDHFLDDAIKADGRGHFLSSYDGEENEAGEFYIYRTN
jgi:hypothetical protein